MLQSQELRTLFLEYFEKHYHTRVESSSLVPLSDKSLLFTNAGMVPFKGMFSGYETIEHDRFTSVQRCLRAGGKHNDLDNVGYTARHHTFFEMLGNFSFGAYFKREAIQLAWQFLTKVLQLPPARLWVTVFEKDHESADIWLKEMKVDKRRFSYCGVEDNFWSMGEQGPCGPCTEIFYDHGDRVSGGPPGSPEADGDRYVEIWNLVFMQYECLEDGRQIALPKPCVDTGMGLERLAAVMQGVTDNYETDLFQPLMQAAAQYIPQSKNHTLRVIADHVRAIGFLITDGISPGNEGRNYVLRRIIRRAVRHGYQAGLKEPFLYQLIPTLVAQMGIPYPELIAAQTHIVDTLQREEVQFLETLHQGMQYFQKAVGNLDEKALPGSLVFKLYDTYGFPPDLTEDLAREQRLTVDKEGFEVEMNAQRQRSHTAHKFSASVMSHVETEFTGYTNLIDTGRIVGLLNQMNQSVEQLKAGEKGSVILDRTPFYAEAGGQVGDQGTLITDADANTIFQVVDTQKNNAAYIHHGSVKQGMLRLQDKVHSQVNSRRRQAIARHHSATHLLHAVLQQLFGNTLTQKGSLVTDSHLRFDFQCRQSLHQSDISLVEQRINEMIWDNLPINTQIMSVDAAQTSGAIGLFGEKYGKKVRVLSIGEVSKELCGGTHVAQTGELGLFKITACTSVASGIKRIEAVVGEMAWRWVKQLENQIQEVASLLKTHPEGIATRVQQQGDLIKQQESDIHQLKEYLCHRFVKVLSKRAVVEKDFTWVIAKLPAFMKDHARVLIDLLQATFSMPAVIVLGFQLPDKAQISMGVSKQYTHRVNAKNYIKRLVDVVQGKGGGKAEFGQLSILSEDTNILAVALGKLRAWLVGDIDA